MSEAYQVAHQIIRQTHLLVSLETTNASEEPLDGDVDLVLKCSPFWHSVNFVLALCDHAQNGFYSSWEWAPVYISALAVGFLFVAMKKRPTQVFLRICCGVLGLSVVIGVIGFGLHFQANWQASSTMRDNFLYGAPILAPLLLPNLALLAGIGIWDLFAKSMSPREAAPAFP